MPSIPRFERATVSASKLGGYLLSDVHRIGAPKYRFLKSFGFSALRPDELEAALLAHGASNAAGIIKSEFGVRYEVDGPLQTPSGVMLFVRTVWQEHAIADALRFVTLVPK